MNIAISKTKHFIKCSYSGHLCAKEHLQEIYICIRWYVYRVSLRFQNSALPPLPHQQRHKLVMNINQPEFRWVRGVAYIERTWLQKLTPLTSTHISHDWTNSLYIVEGRASPDLQLRGDTPGTMSTRDFNWARPRWRLFCLSVYLVLSIHFFFRLNQANIDNPHRMTS